MSRRGTILFVVILALTIAALVTAGMIQGASAARASARAGADRDQLRALAWSGVLGAMNELASQRDALVKGKDPALTGSWQLFASGGDKAVVTLQKFGALHATSECARLDVNGAAASDLARVDGLADLAPAIASGQPWTSPEELRELASAPATQTPGPTPGTPTSAPSTTSAPGADWLKHLTTFSADAQVTQAGAARLVIADTWDLADAKAAAAETQGLAPLLEALAAEVKQPTTMSGLLAWLTAQNAPPAPAGHLLDLFCDSPGVHPRVVDLNRADAQVLAALPGMDAPLAQRLVAARERLDPNALSLITWPVSAGVLSPAQLATLLPKITTRSLVWRVRVIAQISPIADQPGPQSAAGQGPDLGSGPLAATESAAPSGRAASGGLRMILDAVIDVTGATPRLAYLRDASWEGLRLPESSDQPNSAPDPADSTNDVDSPPSVESGFAPPRLPIPAPSAAPPPAADNAPKGRRVGRWLSGQTPGGG